ncbi:MAG: HEAT repeat domain-containing protein [Syntrophaceae bacterium]|nr:HEAT repeat domain-containing protein [Syntrophaceae bacterium]
MRALGHPVRENRMMAIRILGDLKSQAAVPALGGLLDGERDYYVIREAVVALRKIGGPQSLRRIRSLQRHPSRMVRRLSRAALGNGGNGESARG